MKKLDSKYFTTVDSKTVGRFRYETIRSKFPGATAILVSRSDPSRPIAAISFIPNEALDFGTCDVVSALMPRESVPERFKLPHDTKGFDRYFQAMFNQGNREMAFIISNLIDSEDYTDRDYVKIDILNSLPPELNLTDYYDHGVNNVNEIRPSDSYAIRSDQTRQYRTMVLKGVCNEQGQSMSVTQVDDAIRRGETLKKEENYFFVNVVASQTIPEVASLLSDSTWIAADFFVRKIPLSDCCSAEMDMDDGYESARVVPLSFGGGDRSRGVMAFGGERSRGGVSAMSVGGDRSRGGMVSASYDRFNSVQSFSTMGDRGGGLTKGLSRDVGYRPQYELQSGRQPDYSQQPQSQSAWATSSDIGGSQAGRVSAGSRVINQLGNQTNARYCHTSPGEKLVLCFSVWHGMRSVPAIDQATLLQESRLLMDDAQSTEKKALFKMLSKVFKSDDCCVCFEPNPSIVLLRCTHQCVCANCSTQFVKKSCPICRQQVSQSLDSSQWQNLLK